MRSTLIAVTLLSGLAMAATAQPVVDPVTHTGAIVAIAGDSVMLKEKDGTTVKVAMTTGWTVVTTRAEKPSAIKSGEYVATANTNTGPDSGRATEVRILEPGYLPEYGSHAIGRPNTSMTHALVKTVTPSPDGLVMDVTYPGGSRRITVPGDAPLTGYDLRDRVILKPGTIVAAVTRAGADNVWRASRLQIVTP
jgi:hypothetical protein